MIQRPYVFFAWFVSLVAMFGSLFFSEVMKLPPCVLCWYQRILMYPLVLILAVGWLLKDRNLFWYAFPLAIGGWLISIYHNLLYYGVIADSIIPCTEGISCTSRQIEWFGFLTIPLMSHAAFKLIGILLLIERRKGRSSA